MAYRDELTAAQQRIETLEAELETAREENERLRAPKMETTTLDLAPPSKLAATALEARPAAPLARPASRLAGLFFHRPKTYFPLVRLYRSFLLELVEGRPRRDLPDSDQLSAWIAHIFLLPLVYGLWFPAYLVACCFAVPVVAIWCLALTPLCALYLVTTRVTLTPAAPRVERDWLQGEPTRGEAARLLLFLMFPLLPLAAFLFVFANVLDRSNDDSPAL